MKKILISALISVSLLSCAQAGEYFVSAHVGQIEYETSTVVNSGTATLSSQKATLKGFSVAKYIDDFFVSATLSTLTFDLNTTGLSAMPSYHLSVAGNYIVDTDSAFLPFGGANISYFSQSISGYTSLGYDQDISTIQTIFASATLGFTYELSEELMFKAEYSHPLAAIPLTVTLTKAGISVATEATPTGTWSVGLIYNF